MTRPQVCLQVRVFHAGTPAELAERENAVPVEYEAGAR
jgi:hypothetical protein